MSSKSKMRSKSSSKLHKVKKSGASCINKITKHKTDKLEKPETVEERSLNETTSLNQTPSLNEIEKIEEDLINEYPRTVFDAKTYTYDFWKNKPVQKFDTIVGSTGLIDSELNKRKVYSGSEPLKLPTTMKWVEIDSNDAKSMEAVANFLKLHYSEDAIAKFKFDYTADFLKWSIGKDGFFISIVRKSNNAICGVGACTFNNVTVFDSVNNFASVNYLCAHPVYRKKKIAFVLIDELVRRSVQRGVCQGCFTTDRCVPTPITTIRCYHRPLNYLKLNKHDFTYIPETLPEKQHRKFLIKESFPEKYVKLESKHVADTLRVFKKYMIKFNIHCNYTLDNFTHLLLNEFVNCYVKLDDDGNVMDFVSYYKLPYLINKIDGSNETIETVNKSETIESEIDPATTEETKIENLEDDNKINVGYLFLYSCNELSGDDMINNFLRIVSHTDTLDMVTVMDTMEITDTLMTKDVSNDDESDVETYEKQYQYKFMKGNKKLFFNFFNWKCPEVKPKQLQWLMF